MSLDQYLLCLHITRFLVLFRLQQEFVRKTSFFMGRMMCIHLMHEYYCITLSFQCISSRSIMNFFLETIQVLLLSFWYNVESFFHLFVPMRKKNICGEVVLITGAGSGIGRLMALEFAALDTVLVLWDINQEGVKETARLAKQSGARKVYYYLCDCSDKNEVYRVADQVRFCSERTFKVVQPLYPTVLNPMLSSFYKHTFLLLGHWSCKSNREKALTLTLTSTSFFSHMLCAVM